MLSSTKIRVSSLRNITCFTYQHTEQFPNRSMNIYGRVQEEEVMKFSLQHCDIHAAVHMNVHDIVKRKKIKGQSLHSVIMMQISVF